MFPFLHPNCLFSVRIAACIQVKLKAKRSAEDSLGAMIDKRLLRALKGHDLTRLGASVRAASNHDLHHHSAVWPTYIL